MGMSAVYVRCLSAPVTCSHGTHTNRVADRLRSKFCGGSALRPTQRASAAGHGRQSSEIIRVP
jgi:hypothetical protein